MGGKYGWIPRTLWTETLINRHNDKHRKLTRDLPHTFITDRMLLPRWYLILGAYFQLKAEFVSLKTVE